ncbi:substrate-binding domain-containing protein [Nitrospirota bacterium]
MRNRTISTLIILNLFIISLLIPSHIAFAGKRSLVLDPFDYMTKKVPKAANWRNQAIKYEDWAKEADLAVTLDQHLYQVMLPFVQKYAKENNLDIAVKEGTCGISAGLLSRKAVDIAGFCCPPGESDRLPGLEFHTVGIAPLAIIINQDNKIEGLTDEQVRLIFSGKISNWSEVASTNNIKGQDLPISPITRLHCKTRPGHWRLILDNEDEFGYNIKDIGTIPDMIRSVASYAGAIGHIATWNIHKYENKYKVKALKLNGINPEDKSALLEGRYPYYRAYNITSWKNNGKENPLAKGLIEYLMKNTDKLDKNFSMVPSAELRKKGWKFVDDELMGTLNKEQH